MDSSVTVDDGFDGLRTWLGIGVRPDVRWFLSPPSPVCSPIGGNVASSWQLFIKVKVCACVCVCVCGLAQDRDQWRQQCVRGRPPLPS